MAVLRGGTRHSWGAVPGLRSAWLARRATFGCCYDGCGGCLVRYPTAPAAPTAPTAPTTAPPTAALTATMSATWRHSAHTHS